MIGNTQAVMMQRRLLTSSFLFYFLFSTAKRAAQPTALKSKKTGKKQNRTKFVLRFPLTSFDIIYLFILLVLRWVTFDTPFEYLASFILVPSSFTIFVIYIYMYIY